MTTKDVQILIRQNLAMYRVGEKTFTEEQAATQLATWAAALKDIPAEAGFLAMQRASTVCRFPVTLADLFEQLRRMQSTQRPTAAEEWAALLKEARKAASDAGQYTYTMRLPDGRPQGQAARERNKARFESLHPAAQKFLGHVSELVNLGDCDDTSLRFERQRFEKAYREYIDNEPLDVAALSIAAGAPTERLQGVKEPRALSCQETQQRPTLSR